MDTLHWVLSISTIISWLLCSIFIINAKNFKVRSKDLENKIADKKIDLKKCWDARNGYNKSWGYLQKQLDEKIRDENKKLYLNKIELMKKVRVIKERNTELSKQLIKEGRKNI